MNLTEKLTENQTLQKLYMPVLIAATAAVIFGIFQVQSWNWACLLVLVLSLIGSRADAKELSWRQFLPVGFFTLLLFYLIYNYATPFWHSVVGWQLSNIEHALNWNDEFNAIPGNDGAIFRIWQPEWLTEYMQWVYMNGFTLSYWICVIRAFFTKDVRRLAMYSLAGYLLQTPLILIFYNTILLQEVWYVQGVPDMLERGLTGMEAYTTAWNCFPSMHTSIAFVAILLSWREKSRWYKWVIGFYCWSIIFSTVYLQVHWVIDVFAGMLFAWGIVKLADVIVNWKVFGQLLAKLERLFQKRPSNAPVLETAATKDLQEK